jgi:peptidoglycan hydrolase-like protein with peptidoglycan-binding domain
VSFLGRSGGARRAGGALLRHRLITATAGAAAAVIVAGGVFAATSAHASGSARQKLVNTGNDQPAAQPSGSAAPSAPAGPLRLLSVTPAGGTRHANGGAAVTLRFSSALAATTPLPAVTPKIAGSWQVSGATATFSPTAGFQPGTKVTVTVPAGLTAAGASAGTLGRPSAVSYTTGTYSTLGLQVLLARLGYLPLTWTPGGAPAGSGIPAVAPAAGTLTANEAVTDAYGPSAGSFAFQPGYPGALTSQWKTGKDNKQVDGAVRAFQNDQGLTMDGVAGPQVWAHLLTAAAAGKVNPNGYTYALASQNSPHETLKVWHNGKLILNTPANTGISAANTADGTFPVYERLQFQIMKGTNPDGSKYADPVYWISYFNGGDAVHYFERPGYGYYQSLGCVELPLTQAKFIWSYLTYGTLVTVTGPVA